MNKCQCFYRYDMINIVTGCHIVKDMSLGGMSMIFNSMYYVAALLRNRLFLFLYF